MDKKGNYSAKGSLLWTVSLAPEGSKTFIPNGRETTVDRTKRVLGPTKGRAN